MLNVDKKRVLIISNNVLSEKRNNGKTIVSFIDAIAKENVRQLYFNAEKPTIEGYEYFQITDSDVLRGRFNSSKRGRSIENPAYDVLEMLAPIKSVAGKKTPLKRAARDLIWLNGWKSDKLLTWLDEFRPDTIFFVAGDSGFAYNIVRFVKNRYDCRLVTYITDDYILPRIHESLIAKIRRQYIKKKMTKCVHDSYAYYTISPAMQKKYETLFCKSSEILVNMSSCLYDESLCTDNKNEFVLVYAGSLYYGRDRVLLELCKILKNYNECTTGRRAVLHIYTSTISNDIRDKLFSCFDCSEYCGSVGPDELKTIYNQANALVFVESFEPEMIERTKYSLSTKVPEYLSLKKPILAIGPKGIGSMDYLEGCAICVNNLEVLDEKVNELLSSSSNSSELSEAAFQKYCKYHNKINNQKHFVDTLQK